MPNYKLTYFDFKGRAEPVRLTFAYAKVPYEDFRIQRATFVDFKKGLPDLDATLPLGTVPTLEVDGVVISQTHAICGYLGKQFGLSGANDLEEAKCYMIAGGMEDMYTRLGRGFGGKSKEERAVILGPFIATDVPEFVQKIGRLLKDNGTGFVVGNKVTWADFFLFHGIDSMMNMMPPEAKSQFMQNAPGIVAYHQKIANLPNVKEYIENRPQTAL